MLVEGALAIG